MGQGIAQLAAQAGHAVLLYDTQAEALESSLNNILQDLSRQAEKGRLSEDTQVIWKRVKTVTDIGALAGAEWVIEAVPEVLELKQDLLGQLGQLNPNSILATNTSTLSVTAIAARVQNPGRVVGLHFFNPPTRMKLVEVIPALHTSGEVAKKAIALALAWGKEAVQVKDAPGFLVNRVARPLYGEALKLHGEGIPRLHIDWILRGLGFPMGPFELMDLIGLDVNLASSRSVYEGFFGEPRFRPHPLQAQRVAAGMLGRKTSQGWYRYPPGPAAPTKPGTNKDAAPSAYIVGPNPLAKALLQSYKHTEDASKADFVLDCRILQERKVDFIENLPVVTLIWGHSASTAAPNYGKRPVAGFSLVPPLSDHTVAEVYAPLSGPNPATELAKRYFEAHGHTTLSLADQPGGVGFRILAMLINEAVAALAEGLADAGEINTAMRLGTNYPRGPLEWAELIWLKPIARALEGLHGELGEDRYRPHPLLKRMVAAGVEKF